MADRPVHADSTVPPGAGGGSRQTGIGPARRDDPAELFAAARQGDRRSLARLLTMVEAGGHRGRAVAAVAYRSGAEPRTVGITGAPGAGKSTLTGRLIAAARSGGVDQLAVVAVDPTSPFSGGAVLGDRVRMQDHALDPGVYIRSMATRGHLGGLSVAVPEAARILAAVGFPTIFIETVGVGQVEVEIAEEADTTVVVVNPGWGDAVQANKAGLMEIADVFVINKADRPGVRETRRDLESMLDMSEPGPWRPPILETVAQDGKGAEEVIEAVMAHHAFAESSGLAARRREARLAKELSRLAQALIAAKVEARLSGEEFSHSIAEMNAGRLDPRTIANRLIEGL